MGRKRQKPTKRLEPQDQPGTGRLAADLARIERVLSKNPRSCKARIEKGKLLFNLGKLSEAVQEFRASIAVRETSEAWYCLGNTYRVMNHYTDAVTSYKQALGIEETLETLGNLGALLCMLGDREGAMKYLSRAREKDPLNKRILCNLGELSLSVDRYREALGVANIAYMQDPCFVDALLLLARIYRAMGRGELAVSYYEKAQQRMPDDPVINGMLADMLESRGELDRAEHYIAPFVREQDTTPLIALVYSAIHRSRKQFTHAVNYLEAAITGNEHNPASQIDLYYELGRVYDKMAVYEKAFRSYEKANQLSESVYRSDLTPQRKQQCLDHATELCRMDKDLWLPGSDGPRNHPNMIFIVGMFRTGTSLLEHILSIHSAVHGAGEHNGISTLTEDLVNRYRASDGNVTAVLDQDTISAMVQRYFGFIDAEQMGCSYLVDKSPTNFRGLGLIARLFPGAKIIHTTRDPLDTCLSIYFQKFRTDSGPYSCNLLDLAQYYKTYQKIMRYWDEVLDMPIMEVRYADLVSTPNDTISRILDFCGLEPEPQCFQHHQVRRDINTPSYHQVREPIYKNSLQRWKNYETYISDLITALRD